MTKALNSIFVVLLLILTGLFSSSQAQTSFFELVVDSRFESDQIVVQVQSANGYYFYRDKFKVDSLSSDIQVGELVLPAGTLENDPLFGDVEVYFDPIEFKVPLFASDSSDSFSGEYEFTLHAQGCNKPVGVCYPPQKFTIMLAIDSLATAAPTDQQSSSAQIAENNASDTVSQSLSGTAEQSTQQNSQQAKSIDVAQYEESSASENSLLWNIAIAFGVGILLVFTPCVLPMVPILSGLVVGQQETSKAKAFSLSLAYILGTAVTYTSMGVAAGAAGIHLQAYFQHPAIIAMMVFVLIFLACSMFGMFELRLPVKFQNIVSNKADSVSKGGFIMTIVIGMLSALIVSTCVSPLLILVLGVAMREGSPLIGGIMMFFMALGMGIPLILFALGAQWLLPKAGAWMHRIKEFFGFAVIATAILVASSLKTVPSLLLWSIWLAFFGLWLLRSVKSIDRLQGLKLKALKAIALVSLFWASASGLGAFYGGDQLFNPLERVINAGKPQIQLPFETIRSETELVQALEEAKQLNKAVIIDYYADWCTYCVVMENTTYRDEQVARALDGWRLLKIDVTTPNKETQSAKNYFKIIAPPATLFVDASGVEQSNLRR